MDKPVKTTGAELDDALAALEENPTSMVAYQRVQEIAYEVLGMSDDLRSEAEEYK